MPRLFWPQKWFSWLGLCDGPEYWWCPPRFFGQLSWFEFLGLFYRHAQQQPIENELPVYWNFEVSFWGVCSNDDGDGVRNLRCVLRIFSARWRWSELRRLSSFEGKSKTRVSWFFAEIWEAWNTVFWVIFLR